MGDLVFVTAHAPSKLDLDVRLSVVRTSRRRLPVRCDVGQAQGEGHRAEARN